MRTFAPPLTIVALIALLTLAVPAGASLPALDISGLQHELIRAPAEYLSTTSDSTLEDVQDKDFQPLTAASVNQGITGKTFWVRFRLDNTGGTDSIPWVLHHETSYLDHITLYYSDGDDILRKVSLSDRVPFDDRPLAYRTLAFPHATAAGGYTDLYVKMAYAPNKADSVSLNIHLSETSHFAERSRGEYMAYGVFFGVMGTLLLIALLGAALLRQVVYLHYALFLTFSTLMWAALNGFAYQYLWPSSVFLHNEGFHVLFLATSITALQFSRHFLKARDKFPLFNRGAIILQVIMAAGIGLRLLGVYEPVLALSFASLALLALLPMIGYLAWRRGQRYARWYALAWAVYGIGLLISVLSAGTPLFNWGMDPLVFTQISAVLESCLLLVALGERLIAWDRDRRQALTLARQDALTGLNNRRVFPQALEHYQARFRQTGDPVYLIMIDLDHFKELNDQYGHDAGDCVLRAFGRLLRTHCRPGDTCLRYGGEEFAMLVQVREERQALRIAERIRQAFEQYPTQYDGHFIRHTLTAGLAPIFSANRRIEWGDIIREADAALYRAKEQGRNKVVVFSAPADGDPVKVSGQQDVDGVKAD
ncbi:diguanylate cyclase [Marinobacter sp. M1N3S26]|uniref:sensor domain-containing diguanylate cyclase n=1 Tax=Marinobacter sp. M1N3S26 TaxID=3382299 RepID=UPI00387ACB0F